MAEEQSRRAIKALLPIQRGEYMVRSFSGRLGVYTLRDILEWTMSDDSRRIMQRLCEQADAQPGEWLSY